MHRTAQIAQHVIASAVSTTDIRTGNHHGTHNAYAPDMNQPALQHCKGQERQ
jgi:hypothetical protein